MQRPAARRELSDRGGDEQERDDQTRGKVPLNPETVPRERGSQARERAGLSAPRCATVSGARATRTNDRRIRPKAATYGNTVGAGANSASEPATSGPPAKPARRSAQ